MKVSIITIVYNNAACIESCIQSVLAQSYPNIEHIIIDGGSTDGTQKVIEPFIPQLGYYKSEKDKGLYNALNKGIQVATGDVIGILHSDDLFYESTTIEKVVQGFQQSNADLLYAHGLYVERDAIDHIKRVYPGKPYQKKYLKYGWIPLHTTIYVKRDVFESYGLYDESYRIASDYEISLRWFFNDKIKKYFLDDFIVKMRLGGKSTTLKLQKKKSTEDLQIIQKYQLCGVLTLIFKISRKVKQYALPKIKGYAS
ncbi:glycosyltransferase [Polaribacter vadi]|uniref:glycosyltransferase family 2 protein n=1 Tax=Polaribacter TaxID=52959 RepID=UPI001C09E0FB|nr:MULTISPECIES: glycosyltransferase family 2 protein [Polaribacter]MBU3010325.1 glycosyltransferase [Polaribacter vadi]MDO6740132.1 glycosyltransferase family 2 protein [Polaribacter sp. 1_MG-2023]